MAHTPIKSWTSVGVDQRRRSERDSAVPKRVARITIDPKIASGGEEFRLVHYTAAVSDRGHGLPLETNDLAVL